MSEKIVWSNDDQREFENGLELLGPKYNVGTLVSRWSETIEALDRTYSLTIYDYQNDLVLRSLLEQVVRSAPVHLAEKIRSLMEPLDARFVRATNLCERSVMADDWSEAEWWTFRIPRSMGPELQQDLELRGLINSPGMAGPTKNGRAD